MRYQFDGAALDTDRFVLQRDGEAVHLERQVFDVLAYLVDHRDRVVSKAELLDEIWGDRFVSESALTSRIKSARRAVGDSGREQRVIRTIHGRGYQFVAPVSFEVALDDVESETADAPPESSSAPAVTGTVTIMFTDLVASTDTRIALGEPRFALLIEEHDALLGDAIRAHGGDVVKHTGDGVMAAFSAASDGVAAAVDIQRRFAARNQRGAQELEVRIGLGAGDVAERDGDYRGVAVVEAARLCALAAGGQILASESVHQLAGSHGGHEYVALGELELKGLPDHASVAVRWAEDAPVAPPPGGAVGNVPATLDRFVGRRHDLTTVAELVRGLRLVTLTGAGGSGKTRLALEVSTRLAHEFSDGVWLVALADLDDEDLIVETVAAALGVHHTRDPLHALRAHLARRSALIVLDNCEHVVETAAPFVADILGACPDLRVLATSREPLRVPGEQEYSVEPLPRAEAEELLLERRPGRHVPGGTDHEAVGRICEALDGIPLAIELAAARLRVLSLAQIADRLDDQLAVLTDGGRSRPDRQQTLRATLDWSHDLLDDDERIVFRRLAVFAGGFTLGAAEQVIGDRSDGDGTGGGIDRAEVPALVEQLAIRSLVIPTPGDDLRLRMLEPIRQYALEQLESAGELEAFGTRHLAWAGALSSELGRTFFSDQRAATARARLEHANICHALDLALRTDRVQDAVRVIAAMVYIWLMAGQADGERWVDRTVAACPPDASPRTRGDALFAAGMYAVNEGDSRRAVPLLQEALACYERSGRHRSHAWVLTWMGRAGRAEIDGRTPADWFAQALEEFTELDDVAGRGWSLTLLSRCAVRDDDIDLAEQRAREALELAEAAGVDQVSADARRSLAVIAHVRGDSVRAEELFAQATKVHDAAGDRWQQAATLGTAANMATARNDLDRAAALIVQALAIVDDLPEGEATVIVLVAACNFFLFAELEHEVAPIVLGLPVEDQALLGRVTISQGTDELRRVLPRPLTDPLPHHSIHDAVGLAGAVMARWCGDRG